MLLKEKVETAFESLKDSDRMNEWSTSLVESPAGVFVCRTAGCSGRLYQ